VARAPLGLALPALLAAATGAGGFLAGARFGADEPVTRIELVACGLVPGPPPIDLPLGRILHEAPAGVSLGPFDLARGLGIRHAPFPAPPRSGAEGGPPVGGVVTLPVDLNRGEHLAKVTVRCRYGAPAVGGLPLRAGASRAARARRSAAARGACILNRLCAQGRPKHGLSRRFRRLSARTGSELLSEPTAECGGDDDAGCPKHDPGHVAADPAERCSGRAGRAARGSRDAIPRAVVARAVEAAGLEPFVRLARLHPTLFQGIALPIGALLVMCLAMGGPAVLVVGAYFIGCGMILSRKAVKTLLDQVPGSGGQRPA
jgi:hypothetical protein